MNQLKSITYVNAASIPFAKVELDGNTLMVGANGAGKTTVLRSALYFYGVHEDSALGINIRKKKGFKEYYFNELNAFIGFRYSNAYGDILVIAYRSGNTGVKFKFLTETQPVDDMELFFEERVAKSPEELWKTLRMLAYEVSDAVTTLSEYRNILYGHAGAAFKKYAFFDTKEDYGNFIHVLSNVFINSKLDASSIQKTISNAIPGFEPIDLEQIERSIGSFRGKYDDVTKFEQNRVTVEAVLHALMQHDTFAEQSRERLSQLVTNQKAFQDDALRLEDEKSTVETAMQALAQEFEARESAAKQKLQTLNDEIVILQNDIKKATAKLQGYADADIEEKLKLYSSKDALEHERNTLQKQYDELTDTQNTIKERFSKLRETEKIGAQQQLQDVDRRMLALRTAFQQELESLAEEQREKAEKLDEEASVKRVALAASLEESEKNRDRAYREKIDAENRGFFTNEREDALAQSKKNRAAYEEAEREIATLNVAMENINAAIEAIEKEQALELTNLRLPYENTLHNHNEKMGRLQELLNVEEASLLGFIRQVEHPNEELITSLLKDDVLLSKTLEPSFTGETDAFFGFTINSANLTPSDYSKESIEREMELVSSAMSSLEKEFKSDKEELDNRFRNRLNEQRRLYRQKDEHLSKLSIELPMLKNSWARSDDAYRELEKDAQEAKNEAVVACQSAYDKAVGGHAESKERLRAFERALSEEKRETAEGIKAKKALRQKALDEAIGTLETERASQQTRYEQRCARIDRDEFEALANDGVNETLLQEFTERIRAIDKARNTIDAIAETVHAYNHDKKEYFDGLEEKKEELAHRQKRHQNEKELFSGVKAEYAGQKEELGSRVSAIDTHYRQIRGDLKAMANYLQENRWLAELLEDHNAETVEATQERLQDILNHVSSLNMQISKAVDDMRIKQDVLYRDITLQNSLDLAVPTSSDKVHVLESANDLKRFMDEGKIDHFKEEVSHLFSLTINQLSKQTENLLEARQEVGKVVGKIRAMLRDLEGISVIDSIDLRPQESNNKILSRLEQLQKLNDENALSTERNLFNYDKPQRAGYNEALQIIKALRQELTTSNKKVLILDDTYELEIRASENGNDTGWQVSLDEVGSNGTDVMIKAIVNIAMLALSLGLKGNKKNENQTYFHCILDEIGVLHPSYLRELMAFANNKHIRFLNGAPNRQLVSSFKRIYILNNRQQKTMVKPLLSRQCV